METVNTTMNITALVICPNCDDIFDLFEMENLTDEGYIFKQLLPNHECWGRDHWGEIVQCPECKEKITIGIVEW